MAMNQAEADLWKKLCGFSFDDPQSPFRFSDRLARENYWSKEFTQAVLEEYRRFLFLACVADHQVTPSIEVDEAWHLHMIYTRSYWNDLCRDTLGKSVHHGPTRGGRSEELRYDQQYQKTLESYEKYFGESAPRNIWPEAQERFRRDFNAVRVDISRNWVIRKPRWFFELNGLLQPLRVHFGSISSGQPRWQAWPLLVLIIYVFFGLLGISANVEPQMKFAAIVNPITKFDARTFLIFYPIFGVMLLTATYFLQRFLLSDERKVELKSESESAESIALLQQELGEKNRVAFLSISRLLAEKKIDYDEITLQDGKSKKVKTYKIVENAQAPAHPIDKMVFALIQKFRAENMKLSDDDLMTAVNESNAMQELKTDLKNRGLLTFPGNYLMARMVGALLFMIFLAVGLSRVYVGVSRERPVGFLLIETGVLSLMFFFMNVKSRFLNFYTPGGQFINHFQRELDKKSTEFQKDSQEQSDHYWKSVAALGLAVIPATDLFAELRLRYRPVSSSSGGDSYSSSDSSGSSCGGGGGCGGCGGGGD
ncbi:MAG: TIGR04222 domain-containing membrane protein [bacterium]